MGIVIGHDGLGNVCAVLLNTVSFLASMSHPTFEQYNLTNGSPRGSRSLRNTRGGHATLPARAVTTTAYSSGLTSRKSSTQATPSTRKTLDNGRGNGTCGWPYTQEKNR